MIRPGQASRFLIAALGGVLVCALPAFAQAPQLVGGRNVNMTGGSQIISVSPFQVRGDVLGRAQNEPSCAMSTRNPQHILCGANDYRMVDVPGVTQTQLIRDAWLGEFQSTDGGETWESSLAGGFFMDPARHPLRQQGFRAAADAVVRSGPAGLTYYAGIAFTSDKSRSALHVTTYIDVNNRENDQMPFKPVRTVIPASATGTRFIDKPWMYVEAAPAGQMCSISVPVPEPLPLSTNWSEMIAEWLARFAPGWAPARPAIQRVPASIVHVVYTVFLDANDSTAEIMYTRSDNCGQSFSAPVRLSNSPQPAVGLNEHGNGAAIAKPLASGTNRVYAAWRRVRLTTQTGILPDAILSVYSNDNGRTWSQPQVVSEICPFDQGTTATSFRHTAFPTMTADASGRVYIAWSDRRREDGTCVRTPTGAPDGPARIRVVSSVNGVTWTGSTAMPSETPEHQIFPTIAFTAGRLILGWVDFSEDASQVFAQFVNEADALANVPAIRHTGDVRAAAAMPAAVPDFGGGSSKISEYLKGKVVTGGQTVLGQIQWNAVNRRWARKGAVPFNGDYIDIGTLPYLPPLPGQTAWRPNNQATMATPLGVVPTAPQVLFAWADNRDMRTGPDVDNPDVPVPFQTPNGLTLGTQSAFDPTQVRPVCTTGADSFKTGTHNQNTYSARASIGFLAASPGNNKDLGDVTRAFVVYLRNDTTTAKSFRMVAAPPPGGFASFHQFVTTVNTLDVNVPRRSSVARTLYVSRDPAAGTPLNANAAVRVDVVELVGNAPVQAATLILNGDASAPEIEAPEIEAREIYTPEIEAPEIEAHTAGAPEIEAPEIEAPEIEAPEIEAAAWKALGLQRPEIEAPEIEALEIEAPEIEAPEIEATAITDIRFEITNTGNTTAQYNAKAFVTPEPGSDFRYQVIVRRRYELPAVDINCQPTTIALSKVAVNLPDVALGTPEIEAPEIEAPEIEAAGIATFYLEPGTKAEVTIRARSATGQVLDAEDVDIAIEPPVNSDDAAQGITKAETTTTYLTVATAVLPAGRAGTPYARALEASGADGGVAWTLISGELPTGLELSPAGLISGTPTVVGTFSFRVRATDVSANVAERTLTLVITPAAAASLAFVTQPSSSPTGQNIAPAISVKVFTAAGLPAPGVLVTMARVDGLPLLGTLSRTTGATGIAVFDNLALPVSSTGVVLRATAAGFGFTDSIAFNTGLPDLVVSSIVLDPANPEPSDEIDLTFTVTNIGTAAAGPSILAIGLPSALQVEGSVTLVPVPALAAGASYQVTRADGPLPEQEHTASATADYDNLVPESDDANNYTAIEFTVEEGSGEEGDATIYGSPAQFALATNATNQTGPLPNLGSADSGATIGSVTFSPGPGGDTLAIGGGPLPDWYPGLPGNDIALGTESLKVAFDDPVSAFGFYFVEPNVTMGPSGGSPVDSLFRVTLYDGDNVVGTRTFNAPDDQVVFIGIENDLLFDSAEIVDETGADDDEYFGEFYVSDPENMGTFVVTNLAESGPGSLRAAMEAAEAQPGKNQIVFALGDEGIRIRLEDDLPNVTVDNPLIVDATTQEGFDGTPVVEIRRAGESVADHAFWIEADNSVIRGFSISGFPGVGIAIGGSQNRIWGNYFGLLRDGESVNPIDQSALLVGLGAAASFNWIGGDSPIARNVVSATTGTGILLAEGAQFNIVTGNYIGTDATGMLARGNERGVMIRSNPGGNEVTRNVISGSTVGAGVTVNASNGNFIRGNIIGLDATGEGSLPNPIGISFGGDEFGSVGNTVGGLNADEGNVVAANATANILVGSTNSGTVIQGNTIGATISGGLPEVAAVQQFGINITGATGTSIGGPVPAARNRIVGVQFGVQALGANITTIEGNYIGTFDGITPVGEMDGGVFIQGAAGVRVGGDTAAHGNIIGNAGAAVTILAADGEGTTFAVVANNRIGIGDLSSNLANDAGVLLQAAGSGLVQVAAVEFNTIANTSTTAIQVIGDGATQNILRRNRFVGNVGIGIDLAADGPTANDADDTDSGPNLRQNYPTFSAVTPTLVSGSIRGLPATEYLIDLYTCSTGQADTHTLTLNVTTNASGDGFFQVGFGGLAVEVTAMATDSLGNSSEFNGCVAPDAGALVVSNAADSGAGSLREAIAAANALPDANQIFFSIPGWPHTIAPQTPLPAITNPVTIDATTQPGYAGKPVIELNGSALGAPADALTLSGNGNKILGLAINRFRNGIVLDTSDFNEIRANYIGTDLQGLADFGNTESGIVIVGNDNVIGGSSPFERNIISGNDEHGITFPGGSVTTENVVSANYIGVGADGLTPIGNGSDDGMGGRTGAGIHMAYGPVDNQIGGIATGDRNVISANGTGITVLGASPVLLPVDIRGNYIGVDATGSSAIPNDEGIVIENSVPRVASNVISGNTFTAVDVRTTGLTHVSGGFVTNNIIGLTANTAGTVGNGGHGIRFTTTPGNTIAGVLVAANVIAGNGGTGVGLTDSIHTTGITIQGNSIYGNGGPGIDLGIDGVDLNDEDDSDDGPNARQNYPFIISASPETGVIEGMLESAPNAAYRVQIFSTPTCEAFPGGRDALGDDVFMTDGSGILTFSFDGLVLEAGMGITVTATDSDGNTSEFSDCYEASSEFEFTVDFEDFANTFADQPFPETYREITWTDFRHQAPYGGEVSPNGANAVRAAVDGARFTFNANLFLGAWFHVPLLNPELLNPPADQLFFELYYEGVLVHTSGAITGETGGLVFLSSGYFGLVDEVRVRTTGIAMMRPGGSVWIMDDVEFDPGA